MSGHSNTFDASTVFLTAKVWREMKPVFWGLYWMMLTAQGAELKYDIYEGCWTIIIKLHE